MRTTIRTAVATALTALVVAPAAASTTAHAARTAQDQEPKGSLELVGHEPLNNRGMNAALAVKDDHAYIGSRTDGKVGDANLNGAGVLVVDVSKPAEPQVVHEIGTPNEGSEGETSREMRIWPQQNLLIVMNLGSNCSPLIHACSPRAVDDNYRFYDISGKNAAEPKLVAEYKPSRNIHEFFLWVDPDNTKRALMFHSTVGNGGEILVTDISGARKKKFKEIATFPTIVPDGYTHSLGLSNDGKRGYVANNSGGFYIVDTSEVAAGKKKAKIKLITPPNNREDWDGPAHSAVKLYGKDWVLTADELYGDALRALGSGGCPWGWTRMIDVSNEKKPNVVAEYKIEQNNEEFCTTDPPRPSSSYSAHNPTLTKHLAFISWHAGGLQAVDISNPAKPVQAAEFIPDPLPVVLQEDPALSAGQDKVVVWSYPIIKDGLVYVADVRNGLYILKYKGPYAGEVSSVDFIEGNSNLLDALRFEKP